MNTKVPKGVQLDKCGKYNYCLENSHSFYFLYNLHGMRTLLPSLMLDLAM